MLIDWDLKTKLCRHGETGSTIRSWVQQEARARAKGETPPPRSSPCDCTSTEGLKNRTDTRPSTPPASLYDALAAAPDEYAASAIEVDGQGLAYALPGVTAAAFLAANGDRYCAHHRILRRNRLKPNACRPYTYRVAPRKEQDSGKDECMCRLVLPKRSVSVSLGR